MLDSHVVEYQKNNISTVLRMDINNNNFKRILCFNVINNSICTYGTKCVYAHSLSDQKIEPLRHKIYTIIRGESSLKDLDLINDDRLFRGMLELTKLCTMCVKRSCPGGYNCRNGAINIDCRICFDDFMYGNCRRHNCTSKHLTQRGLVPYYYQLSNCTGKTVDELVNERKEKNKIKNIVKLETLSRPDTFFSKPVKPYVDTTNNLKGVLLTEKFLMNYINGNKELKEISSDSEPDNVDNVIRYLNDNSDSEEDSIFKDEY